MLSVSPLATKKTAALFAKKILSRKIKRKNAIVVGLVGELGSGKTTFIQGFARTLGVKHRIASPTFLIIRNYKFPDFQFSNFNFQNFYHIDAYRIRQPKELLNLSFKNIIADPKNIILIEWADKIKKIIPKKTIWIRFAHGEKENERVIEIL